MIDLIAVASAYNEYPLETEESIALLQILQHRLNQNRVLWKFCLENVSENLKADDFDLSHFFLVTSYIYRVGIVS
jgi:phospholipid N-methyltransferase